MPSAASGARAERPGLAFMNRLRFAFFTAVLAAAPVLAAANIVHPKPKAAKATPATPSAAASASPARPDTAHPAGAAHPSKPVPADSANPAKAAADTLSKPLRDLGQKALKVPEKLLFDIIWGGWSFRWVTAGQATLELLPTDRPETWKIRSLAWCNGFFRTFYPVRDTVISLVDSRGIYPLRFEKHLHEGSYNANLSATYDQARHTVTTQDTTFAIEPFTHDVMSAFYFIRTQRLTVGDTLLMAAVSGKKKYNLKVLCHGRETITVAAGTFKTLVVEPVLKEDGLFKAKGKLTIWVTDDETHMPVKMESKIPVGSIKAELVSKS